MRKWKNFTLLGIARIPMVTDCMMRETTRDIIIVTFDGNIFHMDSLSKFRENLELHIEDHHL